MFLSLIFHSKSCIQNCLNSSIRDTVLVTTATITISNIFFLSQGSSHNNIVKLQSDSIRDKKVIFLVLDPLKVYQLLNKETVTRSRDVLFVSYSYGAANVDHAKSLKINNKYTVCQLYLASVGDKIH